MVCLCPGNPSLPNKNCAFPDYFPIYHNLQFQLDIIFLAKYFAWNQDWSHWNICRSVEFKHHKHELTSQQPYLQLREAIINKKLDFLWHWTLDSIQNLCNVHIHTYSFKASICPRKPMLPLWCAVWTVEDQRGVPHHSSTLSSSSPSGEGSPPSSFFGSDFRQTPNEENANCLKGFLNLKFAPTR